MSRAYSPVDVPGAFGDAPSDSRPSVPGPTAARPSVPGPTAARPSGPRMTGAASTNERIAGRRVLVAEDNAVIAMDLQMMLEDQGAVILGPVSTVEDALSLAGKGGIDVALLDVDLNGSDALPVIVALSDRQVPVVLVTGHLDIVKRLPEAYRSLTVVGKPFTERTIVSAIEAALPPLEKPVG